MAFLRRPRDTLVRSNMERNLDEETRFHLGATHHGLASPSPEHAVWLECQR
jgi:hypothetical protein